MPPETWIADFEYNGTDEGNNVTPVCFCATELNSGRTIKMWLAGVKNPIAPIDFKNPELTFVAFYSVAEMSCHYALGWCIPSSIIDLYCEWKILMNDGQPRSNSLLAVCNYFGIPTIESAMKDKMRDRIIAGGDFTDDEKQDILNYCETDIIETSALYKIMQPLIDNRARALFRGQYMAVTAKIEHNGVPLDMQTLNLMKDSWESIKIKLIKDVDQDFGFFEGTSFKTQAFADYLEKNSMGWALTSKGHLALDDRTWSDMVKVYPQLQSMKEVRALLGKFKTLNVVCGNDGNNRGMLSPFSTKTGRNAPNKYCIFTNPSWLRCLIKPKEGRALAYIDYEQQEFCIAATLSHDAAMVSTYLSGDPYLQFAKLAGAIPPEGTKKTHKSIRDMYKQACLGIQYGMAAKSLSLRVNKPLPYAQELITQHQRLFPKYWTWQNNVIAQANLNKQIQTLFGWKMKATQGTHKEAMTLGNWMMQATGADILKIACIMLDEAGIKIVAPVHDALMVEVCLDNADQDILKAEKIMQAASKIVIGMPLRTETVVVKYPNHYNDEKGKVIYDKVMKIIENEVKL